MESAGYADKFGGLFEDRWALRLLFDLLSGEFESLEREPVGDDEAGADLWGNRRSGIRECFQCKAENGDKRGWSLTDLRKRGVLSNLRRQLDRDTSLHRFILVSATPAPDFEQLCRSARDSRDAQSFFAHQVQVSVKRAKAFVDFCTAVDISNDSVDGLEQARSLLARSRYCHFQVNEDQWRDLRARAGAIIKGNPGATLHLLGDWIREQLRVPITLARVRDFLESCDLKLLIDPSSRLDASMEYYIDSKAAEGKIHEVFAKLEAARQGLDRRGFRPPGPETTLRKWKLQEEIGSGAFAKVWYATCVESRSGVGEPQVVAIRELHEHLAKQASVRSAFLQGVKELQGLVHDSILRVLEGPFEEGGRYFYVTEYLPGGDLQKFIFAGEASSRGLSRSEYLWKVIQSVGDALSFAHRRGRIHCDVKPSNILLGEGTQVKLADFDLIRCLGPLQPSAMGGRFGTWLFSAPEMHGDNSIGVTVDVFSLAMTIISIIFGRQLPEERCASDLWSFIDDLNCPKETRRVLRKATELEARARYQTVAEFLACLGPESLGGSKT